MKSSLDTQAKSTTLHYPGSPTLQRAQHSALPMTKSFTGSTLHSLSNTHETQLEWKTPTENIQRILDTLSHFCKRIGEFFQKCFSCVLCRKTSDGRAETRKASDAGFEVEEQLTPSLDADGSVAAFQSLPLSTEDKQNIRDMVKGIAVANWNICSRNFAFYRKREIQGLGDTLKSVHPLRFLGYIFSQPSVTKNLETIREDATKWSRFIKGISEKLDDAASRGNLAAYSSGFATVIHRTSDTTAIQTMITERKWQDLITFLLSSPHTTTTSATVAADTAVPQSTLTKRESETSSSASPAMTSSPLATATETQIQTPATTTSTPSAASTATPLTVTQPPSPPPARVLDLSMSKEQQDRTDKILTCFATYTPWHFWRQGGEKKKQLLALSVNPIRLVDYLFSKPELVAHLRTIQNGDRSTTFFTALYQTLGKETNVKTFSPYIVDFAARRGVDITVVEAAIKGRNWQNVVETLLRLS